MSDDEDKRIRQYSHLNEEQKALAFQAIKDSFGMDARLPDTRKIADKAEREAEKAKTISTKIQHLGMAIKNISQMRDEAALLFQRLEREGETPDPDLYWAYLDEATALMNRLGLAIEELKYKASTQVESINEGVEQPRETQAVSKIEVVPEYMDVEQVAAYLKVSTSTIYHKSSEGLIPTRRIGAKLLFSKKEIDEWLSEQDSV